MSVSNPRVLFTVIALCACFVVIIHVPRQSDIGQKIAFWWNNVSFSSLDNPAVNSSNKNDTVMPRSTIVIKKVPNYDPYSAILHIDKESPFLDVTARHFLHNSRFFTFPSKYKEVFVDTLVEFDRIWRQKLNRTYILYGGTLLGAYRHGQMIPWDDDLDILVDLKYNKTLVKDLKGTNFSISYLGPFRKLFFTHNGTITTTFGHWPFIDLFFFTRQKNGKKIKTVGYDLVYPTNSIFPTTQIAYEGRMFLGPRCPKKVVQNTRDAMVTKRCCTHHYNHRLDKNAKMFCISCSKLHGLFRFVTWRRINDTHSQQMTSDIPELSNMAAVYKSKKKSWKRGPVVFMPKC